MILLIHESAFFMLRLGNNCTHTKLDSSVGG